MEPVRAKIVKAILIGFAFYLLAIITIIVHSSLRDNQAVEERGGWCYWKNLQDGDSIAGSSAGVYQYQLYATSKGIEVWLPCGQK